MAKQKRSKLFLWASMLLSLFGVAVMGVSTAAWFQIDATTRTVSDENLVRAGTANLEIKGITGYKIDPPIGSNGFRDTSVTNVISASGTNLAVDNGDQGIEDTDFEIPSDGAGYYLVKRNPGGTFRYKYNGTSYSKKFSEFEGGNTAFVDYGSTFEVGDVIRVRSYTWSGHKTDHGFIKINHVYGAGASIGDGDSAVDVTIGARGTYRIWLDYTAKSVSLGFEAYSITSGGASIRAKKNQGVEPKRAAGTDSKATISIWHVDEACWNINVLHVYGINYDTGYDDASNGYGYAGLETWFSNFNGNPFYNNLNITYSIKRNGNNTDDFYIKGTPQTGNNDYNKGNTAQNYCYVFPFWVKSFTYQIAGDYDSTIKNYSGNYTVSEKKRYATGSWQDGSLHYYSDWSPETINYSFPTQTVTYHNQTFGEDITTDTAYKFMRYDVLTTNAAKGAHYSDWIGWYLDSGFNTSFSYTNCVTGDFTIYGSYSTKTALLKASFWIGDNPASFDDYDDLGSITLYNSASSYTAPTSGYNNDIYVNDPNSGSFLCFKREGASWYAGSDCGTTFASGMDLEIFAKYVASPSDHRIFYVNTRLTSSPDAWEGVTTRGVSITTDPYATGIKVAPNIYRLTMPVSFGFRICNLTVDPYDDYSDSISDVSGYPNNEKLVVINGGTSGNQHGRNEYSLKTATYATAKIQKYSSGWVDVANGTMSLGDWDDSNYFVFEKGIDAPVGTEYRIAVSGKDKNGTNFASSYGHSDYLDTMPFFLKAGSNGGFTTDGYSGTIKLNFYLTFGKKVSVVQVPVLGNGFYIMDSAHASWNDSTSSFKMTSSDGNIEDTTTIDHQWKAIVNFHAGDIWKPRSKNWLDSITYESGTGSAIASGAMRETTDGNKNVEVVTSGYYEIYLKQMKAGGWRVWITSTATAPSVGVIDNSFNANCYYIVGNSSFNSGSSPSPRNTGTSGYFGGTKMSSGSDVSASYIGFYAREGQTIYVRSYVNAVDTLYTGANRTNSICAGVRLNTTTGVITFDSAGFYNIYVFNGAITVETFQTSDFFRLNPLDISKNDTYTHIWQQKTALILELEISCENAFDSVISATMTNSVNYIGATLYCSHEKLSDPYDTLHGKETQRTYYSAMYLNNSSTTLVDRNNQTLDANDYSNYYVYILVDYLPTNDGLATTPSYPDPFVKSTVNGMQFVLQATQV